MRPFERNIPKFIEDLITNRENYKEMPNIAPLWSAQLKELTELFIVTQKTIPNLVYLDKISKNFSDVLIVGDIHGDLDSLLKIIEPFLQENVASLLFLGDYVDRGDYNFLCLLLIVSLSIAWPERVVLLRGNHEDVDINQIFGFYQELEIFFPISSEFQKVLSSIDEIYNHMSLIAITPQNSVCMHAGIPKTLTNLGLFDHFPKPHSKMNRNYAEFSPTHIKKAFEAFVQIRWNDPTKVPKFPTARSYHGYYFYNRDDTYAFLEENHQQRIIKSHESLRGGFQEMFDNRLYHIFSTEPYDSKIEKAFVIHEYNHNKIFLRDLDFNQVKILEPQSHL